jgi:nucleotide-binding universal stress UspA family protein
MYKHILVPTDGSELSIHAVREASRLAAALGSKLLILHVRSPLEMPHHVEGGALTRLPGSVLQEEVEAEERALMERAVKVASDVGVSATPAFINGTSPYQTILKVAAEQKCDLIVMASHGRRGLTDLLIASETKKLLTHVVSTPVLVVR